MKKGRNSGEKDAEGKTLWTHVTKSVRPYGTTKAADAVPAGKGKPTAKKPPLVLSPALPDGEARPEARLDLHGMTQAEAFDALLRFIPAAAAKGKRTILVITGKSGVLKGAMPLWLENPQLAKHVRTLEGASPKDGGSGAFYVRLKKK